MRNLLATSSLVTISALSALADMHVGRVEAMTAAINKLAPVYSPAGNPLLTGAVQAVQKWKFTPFTASGEATRAVGTVAFDFKP